MSPVDRRLFLYMNWAFLGLTAILFALGVLNLYSAGQFRLEEGMAVTPHYQKQLLWGLIGLCGMIFFMLFDYRRLNAMAWPMFGLTVGLLVAVLLVGRTSLGAKRWLDLGIVSFQPSELAKISVLLLGARLLAREQYKLGFARLFSILSVGFVLTLLIALEPDLGSGLSILLILGGMILFRGLTGRVFKTLVAATPFALTGGWFILHDYQKRRILGFLNPADDPLGAGYHIIQSQIAIGSGRFWGKGFLGGTQSHLRFLPEKHTDFAVAVFCEEWGFVGSMLLLVLFCAFLYQLVVIAREAKDAFGGYLAAGVFFYFFWQILINTGMVLGLMPVVGIPLPFFSYGGSSTLVNFCLIGIALNVSMRRYIFKQA